MRETKFYFCPGCDWELEVGDKERREEGMQCPQCKAQIGIDTDADDGRDATKVWVKEAKR